MSDRFDYLIVGGGMVADAAARGIRELDESGRIGIVSADSEEPYARPALSKKLWTDPDFDWDQVPLGTAQDTGAEIRLNTLVTAIDRTRRRVATGSGEIEYDRLLLATGATPRTIDAPDDERVVAFRSARDYWRLREFAEPGARIAVVGGGYPGSELAAGLSENGVQVILVHPDRTLGAATFPPALANHYAGLFRKAGVVLMNGRRAERVESEEGGFVLRFDDGSSVGADVVVIGLGVDPVTGIAVEAGLEVGDGVIVDEKLVTSDDRIWAAGDIANYPDAILGPTRVEHVDNAQQMGRAAGRAMAGDSAPYSYTPYFYSAVFEQRWEAVGRVDARLNTVEDWVEPLVTGVVYYLEAGVPVGVLLWNVEGARDAARAVLANPPAPEESLIGRIRPSSP